MTARLLADAHELATHESASPPLPADTPLREVRGDRDRRAPLLLEAVAVVDAPTALDGPDRAKPDRRCSGDEAGAPAARQTHALRVHRLDELGLLGRAGGELGVERAGVAEAAP